MSHKPDDFFDRNSDRFLAEWKEFLAIPSIGVAPEHDGDCAACARWLNEQLDAIGFDSRLLQTSSKPVVFAERAGAAGRPVVLFYGHYDVQPVDPVEAWDTPPFEPSLRDGRLYARGAEDNKGQTLYALKAMEGLIRGDVPLPPLKILIEGEEESGSRGLRESLPRWRSFLSADVLMTTDAMTVDCGVPTLIMGQRGLIALTAALKGPHHDLHSGVHGGAAPNPAVALARLLATLHDPEGRIAVDGFYDGTALITEQERALAAAAPFDPQAYAADTGVPPIAGEPGFTPAERVGFRPALDVNGMHAGYHGKGIKTIIPAEAEAKITGRLAAGQEPRHCLNALIGHLRRHAPAGLRLEITGAAAAGRGFRLNPDSPLVTKARRVLDGLTEHPAVFRWEGASIPVIADLAQISGAEPLIAGFGRTEDRAHAPNESFSLDQFRLGYRYVRAMLSAL